MSAGITGYADIIVRRKDGSVKAKYRMPNAVHDNLRNELRDEVKNRDTMTMTPKQMVVTLNDGSSTSATLRSSSHASGATTPPMLPGTITSAGDDYELSYTCQGIQFSTLSATAAVESVALQNEGGAQIAETSSGFTGSGATSSFDSDDTLDVTYTLEFSFSNGNNSVANISDLTKDYRLRLVNAVKQGGVHSLAISRWEIRSGANANNPGLVEIMEADGPLSSDTTEGIGCQGTITVAGVPSTVAPDTVYGYTGQDRTLAVVFLISLNGSWVSGSTLVFTPVFTIT